MKKINDWLYKPMSESDEKFYSIFLIITIPMFIIGKIIEMI